MTIPVDGIAPIVLAVLPISDNENSATLLPHLKAILLGLISQRVQVVSYSCDGTGRTETSTIDPWRSQRLHQVHNQEPATRDV